LDIFLANQITINFKMDQNEKPLRAWIDDRLPKYTAILLNHRTNADPKLVSDFVYSLLKAGKSARELDSELKSILNDNTESFVDKLMDYEKSLKRKQTVRDSPERRRYDRSPERRRYSPDRRDRYSESPPPDNSRRFRNDHHRAPKSFNNERNSDFERRPKYQREREEKPREPPKKRDHDTLCVMNIPPNLLSIEKLNGHFKQFGNVMNINLKPELEMAFVQMSSSEEAFEALGSTEPVLGSRSIRVQWGNREKKPLVVTKAPPPFVPYIPKKKETNTIALDQSIEQIKNYKEMLDQLEKMPDGPEKTEMTEKMQSSVGVIQSVINQQKKPEEEVKLSMQSTRGGYNARGGGRGGYNARPVLKLDNRTSIVQIKSIPNDKLNESDITQHFTKFKVKKVDIEGDVAFVEFENREVATQAIIQAKMWDSTKLEMIWAKPRTGEPSTAPTEMEGKWRE
jgi:hypothetical protein